MKMTFGSTGGMLAVTQSHGARGLKVSSRVSIGELPVCVCVELHVYITNTGSKQAIAATYSAHTSASLNV